MDSKVIPGSEAMGREVDQSLLPTAKVRNEWSYTSNLSIPSYRKQGQLSFHYFESTVIIQFIPDRTINISLSYAESVNVRLDLYKTDYLLPNIYLYGRFISLSEAQNN